MERCRGCGRPIRWLSTANGCPFAVDILPDPKGNVVILPFERTLFLSRAERVGVPEHKLYRPHIETCPARLAETSSHPAPKPLDNGPHVCHNPGVGSRAKRKRRRR